MSRVDKMHVRSRALAASAWLAVALASSAAAPADAGRKTFFDYIEPTPVTCPLTGNTWGTSGPCPSGDNPGPISPGCDVLPRDTCNGIESAVGPNTPPAYYYWDGKILRSTDGTYHLFASTWQGSNGFNPGWFGSDPEHLISDGGLFGPYARQGFVYSMPSFGSDPHHGHNTSAFALADGTYALVVSEVVPFTVFTARSLDGPWTPCSNPGGELFSNPNHVNTGSDGHLDSNVSVVARPDGKFEAVQRHGLIAIADNVCGPYVFQKPTNDYPSSEQPSGIDSVYPNRQVHDDPLAGQPNGPPLHPESTYGLAEDPVIWYSGGLYHILYDYPDDRVGYHLTSPDGINGWTDRGFAYDPRLAKQLFGYAGSSVANQWYKMERPGVYIESGHVVAVTWAVSDVDKNSQIPGGSNHGSKVVVVPFDGLALDCDLNADAGGCGSASDATARDAGVTDATLGGEVSTGSGADAESDATLVNTRATGDGGAQDAGSAGRSTSGQSGSVRDGTTDSAESSGAGVVDGAVAHAESERGAGCAVGAGTPLVPPNGALLVWLGAWACARRRWRQRTRESENRP